MTAASMIPTIVISKPEAHQEREFKHEQQHTGRCDEQHGDHDGHQHAGQREQAAVERMLLLMTLEHQPAEDR